MRHPGEEQLILYYFGEHPAPDEVKTHLAGCGECRGEYEGIVATLAAVGDDDVPERGDGYGREVWARLQGRLERPSVWATGRWWMAMGAVAAMVVLAVMAGRVGPQQKPEEPVRWEEVRQRILLSDVGEHLERAEVVLAEAANGGEERVTDDLIEANRLYRQAAVGAGETSMAAVLEDLERTLLEMSHGATPELDEMVFKVRATATQVRARESEAERDAERNKARS